MRLQHTPWLLRAPTRLAHACGVTKTAVFVFLGFQVIRWLADQVQHWGLGDGYSLIICVAICGGAWPPWPVNWPA